MSTRSHIGMKNEDGSVRFIYCHWDGYPSNNGKILLENYTDPRKISELLALGDISSLAPEIGERHDFDYARKFDYSGPEPVAKEPLSEEEVERLKRMCNVYGRDRGEAGTEARVSVCEAEFLMEANEEYTYLFKDGEWFYRGAGPKLRKLTAGACK